MSSSDDDEPPSDLEPSDLSSDEFQETPHMKTTQAKHREATRGQQDQGLRPLQPRQRAGPKEPRNSPLLPMAQGSVKPRASPPSSFQRPLCLPREEMKQPPTGAHNCLQCPVLQREIDNLKDQLVALQCFIDKFQSL
ncbi:uncharacterized protein CXorf49-like isoform X3 [Cervus elaphus]|uniref:uncharacterized protein CXorf49-like isoform X3 n=1 Tax=Cervus elaphus TaxID=9860 RepID=UPI001CC2993D|nr:uncharacterized protein CXorf49-like isoform X3 [Cervus elaphus]